MKKVLCIALGSVETLWKEISKKMDTIESYTDLLENDIKDLRKNKTNFLHNKKGLILVNCLNYFILYFYRNIDESYFKKKLCFFINENFEIKIFCKNAKHCPERSGIFAKQIYLEGSFSEISNNIFDFPELDSFKSYIDSKDWKKVSCKSTRKQGTKEKGELPDKYKNSLDYSLEKSKNILSDFALIIATEDSYPEWDALIAFTKEKLIKVDKNSFLGVFKEEFTPDGREYDRNKNFDRLEHLLAEIKTKNVNGFFLLHNLGSAFDMNKLNDLNIIYDDFHHTEDDIYFYGGKGIIGEKFVNHLNDSKVIKIKEDASNIVNHLIKQNLIKHSKKSILKALQTIMPFYIDLKGLTRTKNLDYLYEIFSGKQDKYYSNLVDLLLDEIESRLVPTLNKLISIKNEKFGEKIYELKNIIENNSSSLRSFFINLDNIMKKKKYNIFDLNYILEFRLNNELTYSLWQDNMINCLMEINHLLFY